MRNAESMPDEFLRLDRRIRSLEETVATLLNHRAIKNPTFSNFAWGYTQADLTLTNSLQTANFSTLSSPGIYVETATPWCAIVSVDYYVTATGGNLLFSYFMMNGSNVDGTGGSINGWMVSTGRWTVGSTFIGTMPRGTNTFALTCMKQTSGGTAAVLYPHTRCLLLY